MGSSTSSIEVQTTTKLKKQKVKASPSMWRTANSLRPNTVNLALACIEGDEESTAVVDAWRFQTSRATRLIVLSPDDPAFSKVTTFEGGSGGGGSKEVRRLFRRVTQTASEIEAGLESSFLHYNACAGEAEKAKLWSALHLYARFMTQCGPSQSSIRALDRDEDLVSELTLHAFQKVQDGKFDGKALFSRWITVVFWNFTRTRLGQLTKEKKTLSGWREGEAPMNDNGNAKPEEGCIYESQLPPPNDEESRRHLPESFLESVEDPSDRVFAGLLAFGLNQKAAAERMGESVVTSRKREKRLRIALKMVGLARTASTQVASA